uniref:Uncharacterized protein n=1 Tax=Aquila chrysaetos chrysaetos TaxID=223781 RepID=A0A663EPZ6_AQUCH
MTGLLVFAGVFVAMKWKKTGKKRMKRPRGPTPWPITGNLEKYGHMFQTKLGSMTVVVLCGIDTLKQALEIQGESSVGRSGLYSFSLTESEGCMTFNMKYREGWNVHKEIAKNPLRKLSSIADKNLTCSCLLQEQIHFEVSEIVRAFRDLSDTAGSFDLASFLTRCLASVICNLNAISPMIR